MSYEITDARIEDPRASIWTINEFLFTGAAVLRHGQSGLPEHLDSTGINENRQAFAPGQTIQRTCYLMIR